MWFASNVQQTLLSRATAYAIDAKFDDGMPRTGKVMTGNRVYDSFGPAYNPAWLGVSTACLTGDPSNVRYKLDVAFTEPASTVCQLTVAAEF